MATLDPATDPQVFPVAQAAPVLLPRVTGAGSPRVRTNLLQSDPWMLNPLEEFPRVPGPVRLVLVPPTPFRLCPPTLPPSSPILTDRNDFRPDQIASLDDDPLDWCGYLTPSVHNGVRRNLYLDSTCYWVIFYVINVAPDSCLTLWNLNPNDGDPEAPDRYARHLTVPLIVPDQQVPIREVGWHFMPMFQAWGGMEYMLKITGNGNRRGEARV